MADSPTALIVSRAFMGVGGAFIMPATLSIITNVFPARERGKAIGVWAASAGARHRPRAADRRVPARALYWGSVFLVNLPIVAIGLLAGFFLIPDSKDPSAPRLDPVGAVLSIFGLATLLFAIIEAPVNGWTDPAIGDRVRDSGACCSARSRGGSCTASTRCSTSASSRTPASAPRAAPMTLMFLALFGSLFL